MELLCLGKKREKELFWKIIVDRSVEVLFLIRKRLRYVWV